MNTAVNVESHIGQYKVLRTLGAGGMGTVYLGEHILLGRRAAIKTLLPALSSHREIVDRFFNEARAISAISDPGVVQIFDFGYHVDGTAYIVMEYLEGESLASRLDRLGKLSLVDALRVTRQVAGSLAAAHALGIVHRDLKPGNVFIIRDAEAQSGERTKILDFGICKLGDNADGTATQTGTMLGTPVYMSPEQCKGAGKVDHRSDIYSVGCVLFHMLTGRPPFDCDSVGEFIAAHIKEEPPVPSSIDPAIPPAVDALVMRCLDKDPAARFQSMTELQAAVERCLAEISDSGARLTASPVAHTPLGEGFKSAYDVNRGNVMRTVDSTPPPPRFLTGVPNAPTPHNPPTPPRTRSLKTPNPTTGGESWFVDSMSVPPSSISDEWDAPIARRRGLGRILLLASALFVGLVGGLTATSYALDERQTVQPPPAPQPATSIDEPDAHDVTLKREVVPPPPPEDLATADEQQADDQTAQDQAQPVEPAAEPAPAAAPEPPNKVERTKVARPPRPFVKKAPAPRRHVPEQAPQNDDSEDLYDAR